MVVSIYKWFAVSLLSMVLISAKPLPVHPFHVSVTEINHNAAARTLEISCKLFTDDFENVLEQDYKTKVDLINFPDKSKMDSLVKKYLYSHLSIKVNGRFVKLNYIGFENESEAVYGYLEAEEVTTIKKLEISNNLMYDLFTDQVNIMHMIEGGKRKSTKVNYPDKDVAFTY